MGNSLSIEIVETRKKLAAIINESNMPPCVIHMVFREMTDSVGVLANEEYQKSVQSEDGDN